MPSKLIGCVAQVGGQMPSWAPRKRARCEATPSRFPEFTIRGKLVVLPLCVLHFGKLQRSLDSDRLAREWLP
jgi:hypothetical protein